MDGHHFMSLSGRAACRPPAGTYGRPMTPQIAAPHRPGHDSDVRAALRLVVATGVASVTAQLLLVREYITQFQGNEFVISLILCLWLVIGAVGSRIPSVARGWGFPTSADMLGTLSLWVSGLAPVSLVAIRLARLQWFAPGVSVGFYPTAGFIAVTMLPYALSIGFLLPFTLSVIRNTHHGFSGATLYIRDAVGDAAGGALFAVGLVVWVSPVIAAVIAGLPLIATAWAVLPRGRRWRVWPCASLSLTVLAMSAALLLENRSLALPFAESVHTEESRYGRVQVVTEHGQTTIYQDGRPVAVTLDPARAESTVHPALCQRDGVRRVLAIGAVSGMMTEIAKYRPLQVDYVELDPVVTRLQMAGGLIAPISGLTPIHMDARRFLQTSRVQYDAVLVNLPDPDTFQRNRFFTDAFMAGVHQRLSTGGVLGMTLTGYANYVPDAVRLTVASLRRTAAEAFRHVLLIPGERILLLASDEPLTTAVTERLEALGVETQYLAGTYAWEVSTDRLDQLQAAASAAAPVNTDAFPYLVRLAFQQWFVRYGASPVYVYAVIALACGFYLLWVHPVESVLFSTGFMAMGLEMLVVFAFQVFYGYVYFQIGAIVTAFLAGLIPGAWLGARIRQAHRQRLLCADAVLVALTVAFAATLYFWGEGLPTAGYLLIGSLFAGVCGFQFPLILALRGDDARGAERAFSADLAGAGMGTLATVLVLLPLTGLYGIAAGLVAVKMVSLLRFVRSGGGSST